MKIKVIAGRIPQGVWEYKKGNNSMVLFYKGRLKTIFLKDKLKSVTVLNQDNIKSFTGKAGWGFAGACLGAAINPVGAIAGLGAGLIAKGRKTELTVACESIKGDKFLAVMDVKMYRKLESLALQNSLA